ncbi:DUF4192 domain-containing protein [Actinomadura atramentaria]|uniref:DUF4192 domain-containing protein n=1 Tax=Actinomadura atramentaria TaxID=1990 RepID=UPI0005256FD4|nr:DUF4192 domain-containing protein [Actinomadura atramentaria]
MSEPLTIREPGDAIAAVPFMLGFHPADSLVCLAFGGPRRACAIRQDLPGADEHTAAVVARNGFTRAVVLGYGDAARVEGAAAALCAALARHGVAVVDALRVLGDRWWPLACAGGPAAASCPPEGRAAGTAAARVTAEAVYAGHAAFASRADLARSVARVEGAARVAMRAATARAEIRFADLTESGGTAAAEGVPFVAELLERHRADGLLPDDDDLAWLGVLLTAPRVRDEAWVRVRGDDPAADVEFWRDATRRVARRYAAAPASLLAYAAYVRGDGALANVALDRALDAAPAYSMALLLREAAALGVPPAAIRLRLTPDDLEVISDRTRKP